MDALILLVEAFGKGTFTDAYQLAREGALATKDMPALMGRASYVGNDVFERSGGIQILVLWDL